MSTPEEIEKLNQEKYEHEYSIAQVSINKASERDDYFQKLIQIRLGLIKKYGLGKNVLDVGCGSGDYLFEMKGIVSSGTGIDFTQKAIDQAELKKTHLNAAQFHFVKGNARNLPFQNETFDLVYSFAALAYMPRLEDVVREISRVLNNNGVAILEIGNIRSLNNIVCESYPEWAKTCHVPVGLMGKILKEAQLKVMESRAFQILPFWGERPKWLSPLLHPGWKRFFQRAICGKMLDEWISNLPFMRHCAFRHIIVCRKNN